MVNASTELPVMTPVALLCAIPRTDAVREPPAAATVKLPAPVVESVSLSASPSSCAIVLPAAALIFVMMSPSVVEPTRLTVKDVPLRRVMLRCGPLASTGIPSPPRSWPSSPSSFAVPTVNVSMTRALPVFTATPNVPLKSTPGTLRSTVALKLPATTVCVPTFLTTSPPRPRLTTTKSVVPFPSRRPAFAIAMVITFTGAATVPMFFFSKLKSPVSSWPARLMVIAAASTRRYGPAGSASVTVSPPTENRSLTTAVVLLIASRSVPWKSGVLAGLPSTSMVTVPATSPAIPLATAGFAGVVGVAACARIAGRTTKFARPPVSVRKSVVPSPKLRLTLLAAMRITFAVGVTAICSKLKLPEIV